MLMNKKALWIKCFRISSQRLFILFEQEKQQGEHHYQIQKRGENKGAHRQIRPQLI